MKTRLIRIGNSQGIRIPKTLVDQCRLQGSIALEVRGGHLVIRPVRKTRKGWEEAFRNMAEGGDDRLPEWDSLPATDWDKTEWTW